MGAEGLNLSLVQLLVTALEFAVHLCPPVHLFLPFTSSLPFTCAQAVTYAPRAGVGFSRNLSDFNVCVLTVISWLPLEW